MVWLWTCLTGPFLVYDAAGQLTDKVGDFETELAPRNPTLPGPFANMEEFPSMFASHTAATPITCSKPHSRHGGAPSPWPSLSIHAEAAYLPPRESYNRAACLGAGFARPSLGGPGFVHDVFYPRPDRPCESSPVDRVGSSNFSVLFLMIPHYQGHRRAEAFFEHNQIVITGRHLPDCRSPAGSRRLSSRRGAPIGNGAVAGAACFPIAIA